MSRPIMVSLIAKDLYLYRWLIVAVVLIGAAAIPLTRLGPGDGANTGVNIGMLLFITDIIVLGIFVAMFGVLKERQEKSLLFVLSLPVSPMQYTIAKTTAAMITFLVPWLVLTVGTIALIAGSENAADGGIPSFLAMMTFFACNFCILLALMLVTRSERWAIAGILITNFSVPAFLGYVLGMSGIADYKESAVAVWSPAVLTVIGAALAISAVVLGAALYLQSRRKDFA